MRFQAGIIVILFGLTLTLGFPSIPTNGENGFPEGEIIKGKDIQEILTAKYGKSFKDFNELDYFVSINEVDWYQANETCGTAVFANLLEVESEDEHKFVDEILERKGPGGTFWTGGYGDMNSTTGYRWLTTRKELPPTPWAPWGEGFPPRVTNPQYAVLYRHNQMFDSEWRVGFRVDLHRFICEIPNPENPLPCTSKNDLLVILDASGSIGEADFVVAKDFVARLVGAFSDSLDNRLSFIVYSATVNTIFSLTIPNNPEQLQTQIKSAAYLGNGTSTHLAIEAAIAMFSSMGREVPESVVVVTDGASGDPAATIDAANRANAMGIKMISVGVGSSINREELLAIAGGKSEHVFETADYNKLVELLRPVSVKACPD